MRLQINHPERSVATDSPVTRRALFEKALRKDHKTPTAIVTRTDTPTGAIDDLKRELSSIPPSDMGNKHETAQESDLATTNTESRNNISPIERILSKRVTRRKFLTEEVPKAAAGTTIGLENIKKGIRKISESIANPETVIANYTVEGKVSVDGNNASFIATFGDGTKHTVLGTFNPDTQELNLQDLGECPIIPNSISIKKNPAEEVIVVVAGANRSSIGEGAIWLSTDSGKSGKIIKDSAGSFAFANISNDGSKCYLTQGDINAENQPAYQKVLNLTNGNLETLSGPTGIKDSSKVISFGSPPVNSVATVDFKNYGYTRINFDDKGIISQIRVNQNENAAPLYEAPTQNLSKDGKIITLVPNPWTNGIAPNRTDIAAGTLVYNETSDLNTPDQIKYRIQAYQPLFDAIRPGLYPICPFSGVFNQETGQGYMAVYASTAVNENGHYISAAIPFIVKLGTDYTNFTKQQIIGSPDNGLPSSTFGSVSLSLFQNSQGKDVLLAASDKGMHLQKQDGTFQLIPINKKSSFKTFLPLAVKAALAAAGW